MDEQTIELKAQVKLLEKKLEIMTKLLEQEGIIRSSDIEDELKD